MTNDNSVTRPIPRVPKGFKDTFAANAVARQRMIDTIRGVYELYGFSPLETPSIEYADALGKFSTDPVFSFEDDDESLLALRYDLTAPLARVFSQYKNSLPMPFRRYQMGLVWRDEKPGPGRFREFYQFDIDTVGSASMAADAEVCCVVADALEAVQIERGDYVIRVNNRKALNGVLEVAGLPSDEQTSLNVLRAIDKLDRLGIEGVRQLLGKGRTDESGDFTKGAELTGEQTDRIIDLLSVKADSRAGVCDGFEAIVRGSGVGEEGVAELREIDRFLTAAGYGEDRVIFDPTVVRGLAYYTGPVFEAALTVEITDETGQKRQFGSISGGGRYDYLVERFTGEKVPATGFSIGVDRLLSALETLGKLKTQNLSVPVVVTAMDKERDLDYQKITFDLRRAGIPAEMYLGEGGFRKQLQYADERGAIVAVIAGSREFEAGEVSLKDLWLGKEMSAQFAERADWIKAQPAQVTVSLENIVAEVQAILDRYR
jgi:histidyl-tRNA synthetase